MWSIFILPVAVIGAVGAVLGLTNAGTIIVVTLATDQWQRRRGHKRGEGVCTDREGGHVFGLRVALNSTDLGQFLAGMVVAFPDLFAEFQDKSFGLTKSEGEFLRSLVSSAQGQLDEYLEVVGDLASDPESHELLLSLQHRQARLEAALVPIAKYLQDVPASRVREAL